MAKLPMEGKSGDFSDKEIRFRQYFPTGEVERIEKDRVPEAVMAEFARIAQLEGDPENGRMENFLAITHDQGYKTYAAFLSEEARGPEDLIYFADFSDSLLGYGVLRLNPIYPNPYVGYTFTEWEHAMQGYGTNRLRMLNAFSMAFYNSPLYSGYARPDPQEKSIWDRLVEEGSARRFTDGGEERYVFLSK